MVYSVTWKELYDSILQGERDLANSLLDTYAATTSYRKAMSELMEPVLDEIGVRWIKEDISLA